MERENNYTREAVITKQDIFREIVQNPLLAQREINNRSLYEFLQYFWPVVSSHQFQPNWHIKFICEELEEIAIRVANKEPKKHDLIINVPPGSTKTLLSSIMFPAWCWTKWPWIRFITASYSSQLSLESADYCRDLLKSQKFQQLYPDIEIREDKDTKSNFRIAKKVTDYAGRHHKYSSTYGGRYTTSVGGTLMGFHGDILIVDDPLNPTQAASDIELGNANRWMEGTLPTRKTNKDITPIILIQQRLHQDDPSGHILAKQKENIRHISLPGEIRNFEKQVQPPEMIHFYNKDGLFDPVRMPWKVLNDLQSDLGQYGYAGQIGQNPTPPGGGMFKVDRLTVASTIPSSAHIVKTVRYWDKAGTQDGGAYTAGVKMSLLLSGKWIVEDVKRGRWGTDQRESIIRSVAEADGFNTQIWVEQEPGSGGKESAEGTIRNLGGFSAYAERPTGDKVFRADPFSVQVNSGNVMLLVGNWHRDFIEELRFFPYSTFKDQTDAAAGAYSHLTQKKYAQRIT